MPDEAEPVETVDPTKEREENAKIAPEADADTPEPQADEPKPGTPDKALQRMQQELGNVTRQLAALTEKKEEQGTLSPADQAKLAKAAERINTLREFAGAGDQIAESVLEVTEKLTELETLKAQQAEDRKLIGHLLNDHNWRAARAKYDGLDVDAIWSKAQTDAIETLGEDGTQRAQHRLASKLFEERCEAAKKRKGDANKPPANNKTTAPGSTTYQVGSGDRTAPVLSDEQKVLAEALSLVREI